MVVLKVISSSPSRQMHDSLCAKSIIMVELVSIDRNGTFPKTERVGHKSMLVILQMGVYVVTEVGSRKMQRKV